MELVRKSKLKRFKNFIDQIYDNNLFLLSSSISYYSAVAIAPFLLILLAVASIIGDDVQSRVTKLAENFSPELGQMVDLIFENVNEGVDLGSVSGLVGVFILLFTSSLVFLQIRYALDVIYGHFNTKGRVSIWEQILEKLFAMFIVIIAGVFMMISSSIPGIVRLVFPEENYLGTAFLLNFFIYVMMFFGIHYFAPTKKPLKRDVLKISLLSSVFFIIGNFLLGFYFRNVATASIYGAAGTLFVFLIWTYYSSFTMFLSVEIFLYLKKIRKVS